MVTAWPRRSNASYSVPPTSAACAHRGVFDPSCLLHGCVPRLCVIFLGAQLFLHAGGVSTRPFRWCGLAPRKDCHFLGLPAKVYDKLHTIWYDDVIAIFKDCYLLTGLMATLPPSTLCPTPLAPPTVCKFLEESLSCPPSHFRGTLSARRRFRWPAPLLLLVSPPQVGA